MCTLKKKKVKSDEIDPLPFLSFFLSFIHSFFLLLFSVTIRPGEESDAKDIYNKELGIPFQNRYFAVFWGPESGHYVF